MSDDFEDNIETATAADLDECYSGKYLGASDIGDRKIRTKIAKVTKETIKQRDGSVKKRIAVYLSTLPKPVVLNVTNKNVLVDALGGVPAAWTGAEIGLYTESTMFGGKPTKGLRLRVLNQPAKATTSNPTTFDGPDMVAPPDMPDDLLEELFAENQQREI